MDVAFLGRQEEQEIQIADVVAHQQRRSGLRHIVTANDAQAIDRVTQDPERYTHEVDRPENAKHHQAQGKDPQSIEDDRPGRKVVKNPTEEKHGTAGEGIWSVARIVDLFRDRVKEIGMTSRSLFP